MTALRFRPSWPNALTLALLLALGVVFFRQPFDLDFCWQVRTGERILDTGHLRHPDRFSFTIAGKELPDHEWLYEAALALVWRGLGDAGLKLMRVLLYFAPIVILAWQLRRRGVADYAVGMSAIVCVLILFCFERLRPLVCSTIGLQLVAGWLYDHSRGRRDLDWRLPVTMLFWGNLHPAVIMGQALILGAMVWQWAQHYRLTTTAIGNLKTLTLYGGLALAATLIAPAPVDRFLYPFDSALRDPAQKYFVEIKPLWHFVGDSYAIWLALALSVLFGLVLLVRRREFFGWEWALIVGVTGLAVTAVRGVGDWLMITTALAVPEIGPLLLNAARSHRWRRLIRPALRLDGVFRRVFSGRLLRLQPGWTFAVMALMALLALVPWGHRLPNREGASWPHGAVDWIAAGHLPTPGPWRIFSGGNEGAYLIWRLDGQARVYSDTRGFYYPGEILADCFHLTNDDDGWRIRLERVLKNDSEYFLLPAQTGLWTKLEAHIPAPLYRDADYVILSADQVRDASQISQHGLVSGTR